jgi:hypothetical protein
MNEVEYVFERFLTFYGKDALLRQIEQSLKNVGINATVNDCDKKILSPQENINLMRGSESDEGID